MRGFWPAQHCVPVLGRQTESSVGLEPLQQCSYLLEAPLCPLFVGWLMIHRNSFLWQERRKTSPCFDLISWNSKNCDGKWCMWGTISTPAGGLQLCSSISSTCFGCGGSGRGAPGWVSWGTPVLCTLSWTELLASLRAQLIVPRTCGSVLGWPWL